MSLVNFCSITTG